MKKINQIILEIRKELRRNSDPQFKTLKQRFFKEKIKSYGVRAGAVNKIAKKYTKEILIMPKNKAFILCEKLWQSEFQEEAFVACNFSYLLRDGFEESDFKVFEKWIESYISNWASCDNFCNHTIGSLIEEYPHLISHLKKWTKSKNRWVRRASAVSLIVPAKRGKFLKDVFEISDNLLLDEDDLVQKGYGWLLKVASNIHQEKVFNYVMKNKEKMPRTSLRYAIEKMPKNLKMKAMEK